MKVNNLSDINSKSPFILILGDCATNHIPKFLENVKKPIYSRQIQGGLGVEDEVINLRNCEYIFLFVSWGNAISVIEDGNILKERIASHKRILKTIFDLDIPTLMIDRHGFLDRFAEKSFLKDKDMIPYPEALRLGWKPQSLVKQLERRQAYKNEICIYTQNRIEYYDLIEIIGITTYRHESGECKSNVVNIAPWHYDLPSYNYAANVFEKFIEGNEYRNLLFNWELGVLDIKAPRM